MTSPVQSPRIEPVDPPTAPAESFRISAPFASSPNRDGFWEQVLDGAVPPFLAATQKPRPRLGGPLAPLPAACCPIGATRVAGGLPTKDRPAAVPSGAPRALGTGRLGAGGGTREASRAQEFKARNLRRIRAWLPPRPRFRPRCKWTSPARTNSGERQPQASQQAWGGGQGPELEVRKDAAVRKEATRLSNSTGTADATTLDLLAFPRSGGPPRSLGRPRTGPCARRCSYRRRGSACS